MKVNKYIKNKITGTLMSLQNLVPTQITNVLNANINGDSECPFEWFMF